MMLPPPPNTTSRRSPRRTRSVECLAKPSITAPSLLVFGPSVTAQGSEEDGGGGRATATSTVIPFLRTERRHDLPTSAREEDHSFAAKLTRGDVVSHPITEKDDRPFSGPPCVIIGGGGHNNDPGRHASSPLPNVETSRLGVDDTSRRGVDDDAHVRGLVLSRDTSTIREDERDSARKEEDTITTSSPAHHLNQTLLKWKSQCFVNMRLHRKSYYHFRRMYDLLSYPIMILAAVTSGSVLGSDTQAVRYSSATLSMIIIVLTSVIRHVRPAEAAQQHEQVSRRFEVILQTLQAVVGAELSSASPKERDDFVAGVRTKLDELINSRLAPPSSVIRDYEAKHGPVEGILYGEDMVSVLVNQARTAHLINAIKRAKDRDAADHMVGTNDSVTARPDFRKKILNFDRDALKRMMGQRDRMGYDDARKGGKVTRFFDWLYSRRESAQGPPV